MKAQSAIGSLLATPEQVDIAHADGVREYRDHYEDYSQAGN